MAGTLVSQRDAFLAGRLEPGVSLYSRKVLIESKCGRILPDWMVGAAEDRGRKVSWKKGAFYCIDTVFFPPPLTALCQGRGRLRGSAP